MSALCQRRTLYRLFDQLVGATAVPVNELDTDGRSIQPEAVV